MKLKIILSAFFLIMLAACKKDSSIVEDEQPLLQDGPLSAQLGKLINFPDTRYFRRPAFWGINSDELFIKVSANLLRIDFASRKIEEIEVSDGTFTGKTNENSGIIFKGKIKYQYGFYVFNFNSKSIEKIISVPEKQITAINIAGNNIFFYQSVSPFSYLPCNGSYCWTMPGTFVPSIFYHLDMQTQQKTDLDNKQFILFSPDGSKAVLSGHIERRIYLYDIASRTIIDSADVNNDYASSFGLFFHEGVLHSFESDVHRNITIKNANSGQVIRQYQTNIFVFSDIRVSTDGTILYFSGGSNGTHKIMLYNISTNTQKIIADLPYLQGGSLPFEDFVLSDDNKKMVIEAGGNLYLKELD